MVTYTQEYVLNLKKKRKLVLISDIIAALLCAAVCVTLCFYVNPENQAIIKTVNVIITVLFGWYVLGSIFAFLLPIKARMVHIASVLKADLLIVEGKVTALKDGVTAVRYVKVTQVTMDCSAPDIFNWDESFGAFPADAGKRIKLSVRSGYICACEVDYGAE